MSGRLAVAAVSVALVVLPASAGAAPGDLDPTFGSGGIVRTSAGLREGDGAGALAIQPDGKILLAGGAFDDFRVAHFRVARYEPDGQLDASFGSGGIATGPGTAPVLSMALQPDGKILLAAGSLVRLLPNGMLDPSFGSGGLVSGPVSASAVALQPDGRIVAAGRFGLGVAVARFEPDGTVDSSFGSGGLATAPISSAADVFAQPEGKILVAGTTKVGGGITEIALARYTANGAPDAGFGSSGVVRTRIGKDAGAAAIALLPNGKILAAGWGSVHYSSGDESYMAVVRYGPTGARDPAFGKGGISLASDIRYSSAAGLAVQPSGRVALAGSSEGHFVVARFLSRGGLDRTFGENGYTTLDPNSEAVGVALQADGKIVAAGDVGTYSNGPQFMLARFVVTTPTTIARSRAVAGYGHTIVLSGRLTSQAANATVQVKGANCFDKAAKPVGTVTTDSQGRWKISVRLRSRTVYRAEVAGERSIPATVAVRPRVTLAKVGPGRFSARVVTSGAWYEGQPLLLLTKGPRGWRVVRVLAMRRLGRAGASYVSGVTFRSKMRSGLRVKVFFVQLPGDCYLPTSSKAITS